MNGFIFGFQRLVWCPKCTPASNNSGTNSVVSAIEKSRRRNAAAGRGRCYTATAKANTMLKQTSHAQLRRLSRAGFSTSNAKLRDRQSHRFVPFHQKTKN